MTKVRMIADLPTAEVFLTTDFEVRIPETPEAAESELRQAIQEEIPLIFITEALAEPIQERILEMQLKHPAVITVIPGVGGSRKLGEQLVMRLKKSVIGV